MADLLFLRRSNAQIMKLEGDNNIHAYVEITREAYDHIPVVRYIYRRVSAIEHDPCDRDRLMARLFLLPGFLRTFDWLSRISYGEFQAFIGEFRDHLSYSLFPATSMEIERQMERRIGIGFGGALLRSLAHIPTTTFSYFER